ncbi:MAG: hypothetical protein KC900_08810 [Candidatus Omnitrophica bacterium]|nr:hypothetical protein [Candidatus Omnitrophota bacterium]
MSTHIIKLRNFSPRRNFPKASRNKRGESNFVLSFQKVYLDSRKGLGAREFPLSGYGIADLVWLSYGNLEKHGRASAFSYEKVLQRITKKNLAAFEFKLSDWKRAFMQAYRYSYFADQSIVVMPIENIKPAKTNLMQFQRNQIGLWAFDVSKEKIVKIFTPEYSSARNLLAKQKAIDILLRQFYFSRRAK